VTLGDAVHYISELPEARRKEPQWVRAAFRIFDRGCLRSSIVRGQRSLEVFCAGVFRAFAAHIAINDELRAARSSVFSKTWHRDKIGPAEFNAGEG